MKAHQMFYLESHLAGRKYHDADLVFDYLRVGQTFRLERDKDNHYDANAVQVIFNKDGDDYLLGYIPQWRQPPVGPLPRFGLGRPLQLPHLQHQPLHPPREPNPPHHPQK